MKSFTDKVVVITGAASGMGRDMAIKVAERGGKVAISDVNPDGLETTATLVREAGGDVHAQVLNVAEREAVLDYAETVAEHFGKVNVVINNAGIAHIGELEVMEFKDIERVMDVNFWGVVNGTKAFLPHLIASGDGAIVNVSSIFGILSEPGQSAYNASKFAVRGFTESISQEMIVSGYPVKVTCVHPGGIKTGIVDNATTSGDHDKDQIAGFFNKHLARTTSSDAAETILRAVEKQHKRVLVGLDAKALDLSVRLVGSLYQGVAARVTAWGMKQG